MEEEKTFEEHFREMGNWLSKNLPAIFAILISVFFLFTGVIKVLPTEMSWKEQTIMTFITIVAGFSITSLVGEYGFTSAKNTNAFINTRKEYDLSVKGALKYREPIDELAKDRAEQNLKTLRIHILESVNIDYDSVFNEYGRLITDFDIYKYKNEKGFVKKLRAYHRAIKSKVVDTNVFGMASSSLFGIKKDITEKEYRTKSSGKSLIIKVLLSVATAGIMLQFMGWDIGALIYAFMQVVIWVAMGLITRQKNYNFIIDEIMPQYIAKRLIIDEFMQMSDDKKQIYIERTKKLKQLPYYENVVDNK